MQNNPSLKSFSHQKPAYIDLFAGCGGLSLGLHNSGWRGIFAIEKSEQAFATLSHNLIEKLSHFDWPEWLPKSNHDINQVIEDHRDSLRDLRGKVDLVAGGPPCQGFSSAGRRVESDSRNQLIDSYLEFIDLVQPKIVFFENVKGFTQRFEKNKTRGKAYADYVKDKFKNELGYSVWGNLIDFSKYGIPQKRTRFILVAIKNDLAEGDREVKRMFFDSIDSNVKSFLISKNLSLKANLKQAISDLLYSNGQRDCPDRKGFKAGLYSKPVSQYQRFMRKGLSGSDPDSHSFPQHKPGTVEKFWKILEVKAKNKSLCKDDRQRLGINKHVTIPLDGSQPSPTLTTLPDDCIHYCEPRILTVREYARIQSFPDWFEFKDKYTTGGKDRVSEVPRYSQIGNAIPPLFAEQSGCILKKLLL